MPRLLPILWTKQERIHTAGNDLHTGWIDPVLLHHVLFAGWTLSDERVAVLEDLVFSQQTPRWLLLPGLLGRGVLWISQGMGHMHHRDSP
jgi:hypothetical protein